MGMYSDCCQGTLVLTPQSILAKEKRFLLDSITNIVSSVTNTVNNVVQTTQNVISTTQLVGQILWDNAFGPSVDLFLNRITFLNLVY